MSWVSWENSLSEDSRLRVDSPSPATVGEVVRLERRWTSPGATPATSLQSAPDSSAEPANVTIVSPTRISACVDFSLVQYSSGGVGLCAIRPLLFGPVC